MLLYYCKSANACFTKYSILLSSKPFSAKHLEAPCPLEKRTQVALGKQKGPGPPVPRALPFSPPAGTLHSGLPKPSDWGSSSFAIVPSSRKPQIHLFAICSKNKMALGNEVDEQLVICPFKCLAFVSLRFNSFSVPFQRISMRKKQKRAPGLWLLISCWIAPPHGDSVSLIITRDDWQYLLFCSSLLYFITMTKADI